MLDWTHCVDKARQDIEYFLSFSSKSQVYRHEPVTCNQGHVKSLLHFSAFSHGTIRTIHVIRIRRDGLREKKQTLQTLPNWWVLSITHIFMSSSSYTNIIHICTQICKYHLLISLLLFMCLWFQCLPLHIE